MFPPIPICICVLGRLERLAMLAMLVFDSSLCVLDPRTMRGTRGMGFEFVVGLEPSLLVRELRLEFGSEL